jgi:hypothetical protein
MKFSLPIIALVTCAAATPTHTKYKAAKPFYFTSTYSVFATPDQVVNATNAFTGGLAGALGYFNYGINSYENVICYNITLENFRGNYSSPATTATHIHQGPKGKSGPPRYVSALSYTNHSGPKCVANRWNFACTGSLSPTRWAMDRRGTALGA